MRLEEITSDILNLRLTRSPLKQAIYEARFPARVGVRESLADFQQRLGEGFVEYEENQQLVAGANRVEGGWAFRNPSAQDKVSVSPSVLNINTSSYGRFDDFRKRADAICRAFDEVLREGREMLRVGLRYINNVDPAIWSEHDPRDVIDSPLGHGYPDFDQVDDLAFQVTYQRQGLQVIERAGFLRLLGASPERQSVYVIDVDVAVVGRVPWPERPALWGTLHTAAKSAFLRHLKARSLEPVFGAIPDAT